jgi:hypothetical protein
MAEVLGGVVVLLTVLALLGRFCTYEAPVRLRTMGTDDF